MALAAEPFGDALRVGHEGGADGTGTVTAAGDPVAAGALGERLRVLGWPNGYAVDPVSDPVSDPVPGASWAWTLRSAP